MLLAGDATARRDAAAAFGDALFTLSDGGGGARWGLVWGAMLQEGGQEGRDLFADARNRSAPPRVSFDGSRALVMLDRWAAAIARHDGERRWRGEGLLLLRIGLIGR